MIRAWAQGTMASGFAALLAILVSCHSDDDGIPSEPVRRIADTPPTAPGGAASLPTHQAAADAAATARVEDVTTVVDYLLRKIADSGLMFIRNGAEHTAQDAADHIRQKYEHFQDEIKTPEDFIAKAATSSMLTGKPYLVKTQDGKTRPVADWLRELLAEYRAQGGAAPQRAAAPPAANY